MILLMIFIFLTSNETMSSLVSFLVYFAEDIVISLDIVSELQKLRALIGTLDNRQRTIS
jgi:hypothetical protein